MDVDDFERRLLDSVADLRQARQRLQLARRDSLCGQCTPWELALAIDAHRRAEEDLHQALDAWTRRRGESSQMLAVTAEAAPPLRPAAVPPRLDFVRWLVRTGRLSDWDAP